MTQFEKHYIIARTKEAQVIVAFYFHSPCMLGENFVSPLTQGLSLQCPCQVLQDCPAEKCRSIKISMKTKNLKQPANRYLLHLLHDYIIFICSFIDWKSLRNKQIMSERITTLDMYVNIGSIKYYF